MLRRCVIIVTLAAVLPWADASFGADYVQGREAAIALYWANKREEALAMFVELAEASITDLQKADALDWASTAALRLKRPDEALQYADQIPLKPMRKTAQARVHAAEGRWQQVLDVFADEDLAHWPPSVAAEAFGTRGGAHLRLENPKAAAADLIQAAELTKNPNARAGALLNLGAAYQRLADPERAVLAYQQVYAATKNVARHADAAIAIAEIRLMQGNASEAVAEFSKVDLAKLTVASLHVNFLMSKGHALTQHGQKTEAIISYRQAMEHAGASEAQRAACQSAIDALGGAGS